MSEQGFKILVDCLLQLSVKHYQVFGTLLNIEDLQLSHDKVQVVNREDKRHFDRVFCLAEVFLSYSFKQAGHGLLKLGKPRDDHVLAGDTPVG